MEITEYSYKVPSVANTQAVSITTSTASSARIGASSAVIKSTIDCFIIRSATAGASTAATTACLPITSGIPYRVWGFGPDDKLSAITASGSGTLYITPDA